MIPTYEMLMLPMLRLIAAGHTEMAPCLPKIAAEFSLSKEDQEQLLPSGKQTTLANRAHWARQYLSQAGLIEPIKRGHYKITQRGRDVLAAGPAEINNTTLSAYPEFLAFKKRTTKTDSDGASSSAPTNVTFASQTPEDVIGQAFSEIDAALISELLNAISGVSPTRFEQLIVDLLLAMGYGGGDREMGQRIGKSGDGGIDGIINEDALGLDAVYIQAKRYAPDNKVGRPALQAFVGSLTGEGATKGVFVTTSDFSKEARDYVEKVQQRIVLINGDRLARLMIQHDVGVRSRKTYVLRSVDEDYFSEG
ncbi:MAG: restriction endonuclease [Limimaricola sp.]|uniref:restriction endonuclease n=1 Tax=Limimaricola sp. TaxID=2211665 RepID=UPI001DE2D940|nr:restriction endonuclease [Limimaricola sp.]MBI1417075.1 restriction endonuclease [Limimaricola sp.]